MSLFTIIPISAEAYDIREVDETTLALVSQTITLDYKKIEVYF